MSAASCKDCLYYEALNEEYGFCRKDPPQVWSGSSERYYGSRSGLTGVWPVICVLDWCGEYKERPWQKGAVTMDEPPPEPDPPEGGVLSTPRILTAVAVTENPLGDPTGS